MNAIQYFDWGGMKEELVTITVVSKGLFLTHEGRNIAGNFPIQAPISAYITLRIENAIHIPVKRSNIYKNGNDLVFIFHLKRRILPQTTRLKSFQIGFYTDDNYFNTIRTTGSGIFFVSSRKVKKIGNALYFSYNPNTLHVGVSHGTPDGYLTYEDGEFVRFEDFFEKESSLILNQH